MENQEVNDGIATIPVPPMKQIVELFVKNEVHGIEKRVDENGRKIDEVGEKVDGNTQRLDSLENKVDENSRKIDENGRKIDENGRKVDQLRDEFRREMELHRHAMDRNFKMILGLLSLIGSATIGGIITVILKLF